MRMRQNPSIQLKWCMKRQMGRNQSNIWIVESSDSGSLNFRSKSWSSEGAISCQFCFHSWSPESVFCGDSVSSHFRLYSWSSQRTFSSNSVSFNFCCDSRSSEGRLSHDFSFYSWSSEGIFSGNLGFYSWSSEGRLSGSSRDGEVCCQAWATEGSFDF